MQQLKNDKDMRVDFNRPFKGYDGRELTGNNIAMSVAEALFNYGRISLTAGGYGQVYELVERKE